MAVDTARGEEVVDVSYLNMDRNNFVIHNSVKLFENSTGKQSNDPGYGFKYTNPNMFAIATSVPPCCRPGWRAPCRAKHQPLPYRRGDG